MNTSTDRCHGHNLDHQGVAHVCTDLCTVNTCCAPEIRGKVQVVKNGEVKWVAA